MHVLIATDADWVLEEVRSALEGAGTTFTVCRNGRDVTAAVEDRFPDVAVLDLQVGSMGGMAVTMQLRHDESSGRLAHLPVVMLLDRVADVHLARRSGAEAWLVKPLNPLRIRKAVDAAVAGGTFHEGVPTVQVQDGEPVTTG